MAEEARRTDSGIEIKPLYTADDLDGWDPDEQLGAARARRRTPAASTRRCTAAGSGRCASTPASARAEATNERFKFLLRAGQTGLSCAFDLPTQMGYDSDHPRAEGEVGKVGVAIDSLDDMRLLLDDIPLDKVTTSMTINSTAAILLLLYELVAEEQGVPSTAIGGTIQNDLLKEYIARGTYVYPPRPSMRIITDIFAYCRERIPQWNTISICGYHIREAGSTAVQEIAFTIANGIAYVQAAIDAGLDVDEFAPAAVVLLERPQQLLRGGRQVPRRPAHVVPDHDRAVRRQEGGVEAAALPHPDRRLHAHRAAAREQHRARHAPGAGGGARRHPEPAHQRLRRGPRPADRAGGADRPAHAADRRLRVAASSTPPTRWPARTSSSRSPTRSRRRRGSTSPASTRSAARWRPSRPATRPTRSSRRPTSTRSRSTTASASSSA